MSTCSHRPILLTGASGYLGGKLWRELEAQGRRVNCLARNVGKLQVKMAPTSTIVPGDLQDPESLKKAMAGIGCAYYLVPALASGMSAAEERLGAGNFAHAAQQAGVGRLVYLGGPHKAGRPDQAGANAPQEVPDILRASGVPTVEFRVALVLGGSSLSFQMIRALVEKFPVLFAPRWFDFPVRPLAVSDLLKYLAAATDLETEGHAIHELGGPQATTYGALMLEYARQRGLRRSMLPLPLRFSNLSSLGLALVAPVRMRAARQLIRSIRYPFVVTHEELLQVFGFRPLDFRAALAEALREG